MFTSNTRLVFFLTSAITPTSYASFNKNSAYILRNFSTYTETTELLKGLNEITHKKTNIMSSFIRSLLKLSFYIFSFKVNVICRKL